MVDVLWDQLVGKYTRTMERVGKWDSEFEVFQPMIFIQKAEHGSTSWWNCFRANVTNSLM